MLGRLLHKQVGPIGIDIGASGVRLVQLKRLRNRFGVIGSTYQPSQSTADEIDSEQIRSALGAGGFTGRRVVVAPPRAEVMIQSIRMPCLAEAELAEAVGWEAAERFGIPRDQLEVDFIRLGEIDRGGERRVEVLIVAVRRSDLQRRLEPILGAGLRPVAVDVGFLATVRTYSTLCRRQSDRGHVRALLEMGGSGSVFMVLHGDQVALCKPLPIGGVHLDRAVASDLGIDHETSRDLRRRRIRNRLAADAATVPVGPVDDSTDRAIFESVRSLLDQIAKEIGLCLRYYGVTFRGKPPQHIVLAGWDALEPRFDELLSQRCKISAVLDDPVTPAAGLFASLEKSLSGDDLPQSWATAAGLSLRELSTDVVSRRATRRRAAA